MKHKHLEIRLIKFFCEQKNVTMKSISDQVGMTATGFNTAVRKNDLKAQVLNKVLQILDIDYYELVSDTERGDQMTMQDVKRFIDNTRPTLSTLLDARAKIQHEIDQALVNMIDSKRTKKLVH